MAPKSRDRLSSDGPAQNRFQSRSTLEVLNNHILKIISRKIDEDLAFNYHPDILLFTSTGIHHGKAEVRNVLKGMEEDFLSTSEDYEVAEFSESYAFVERVSIGSDGKIRRIGESLVIKRGQIAVQMIHILPYDN